jgi:methyl-accepting chemotaxis protein
MKLSKQLFILVIFVALGFLVLGAYGLNSLKSNLVEARKHEIKTVLTFAQKQAMIFVAQEQQGLLSHSEAEAKVIELLTGMREGSAYLWANGNDGLARVHVKAEKIGQFQSSYADDIKQLSTQDFVFKVSSNSKPGSTVEVLKVNGMAKIPTWNWVIGIGVYMDDIDDAYWSFATRFIVIALIIMGMVVASVTFMLRMILRKLGGELNYAVEVTERISQGNLSEEIHGNFVAGSLLGSIAVMQKSLKEMVANIQEGSKHLSNASSELTTQFVNIAHAAKRSSEASISTAAAIQELSSSINEIASSTGNTEKNSERSFELCRNGEALVNSSGQTIQAISQQITGSIENFKSLQVKSNEIGNIANVIRGIAEQTNLLALNAAIEAARAGEQGRGFAVVADEVRNLASRTAAATAEVADTITVIQSETDKVANALESVLPKVQQSVETSNQVNLMLSDIQASSVDTLNMIKEVSSSTAEQHQASDELARHVEDISEMVQSTASSIQNCRETVADLDVLSSSLAKSVAYFNV